MPDTDDKIRQVGRVGALGKAYWKWLLNGPLGSAKGFLAFLITGGTGALILFVVVFVYWNLHVNTGCKIQEFNVQPPDTQPPAVPR
jgi:hypothetical protein